LMVGSATLLYLFEEFINKQVIWYIENEDNKNNNHKNIW
jgi:hypothetical protein